MAAQIRLRLNVISLAKKAAGSNRSRQDAYISALTQSLKREFGKRCIDRIIERTLSGLDKNNTAFANYSEEYKKSDKFRIYGKSSGSVNLKLTGAMQASIDVLETTAQTVTLGFIDQDENDKAHGHIHGSNHLPVRDFWGISESEQIAILKETIKDFEEAEDLQIFQVNPTEIDIGENQSLDFDLTSAEFDNEF